MDCQFLMWNKQRPTAAKENIVTAFTITLILCQDGGTWHENEHKHTNSNRKSCLGSTMATVE